MRITVIGAGFVGLVTASCLSKAGNEVVCVDKSRQKVSKLKKAILDIYEPNLEKILKKSIATSKLKFTSSFRSAANADLIFICVDTPTSLNSLEADLSNIEDCIAAICEVARQDLKIVVKSSVPPGSSRNLESLSSNIVKSKKKTLNVSITSNPEFLREGSAVFDFENPERIVIGTNCKDSSRLLLKLYESITPQTNYILTDPTSAEIIKYSSNSFLATKISFINQVSRLADHFNGDIECISNAIGLDSRIGNKFLKSGMGFGGSCFPKDLRALISIEDKLNLKNSIFREALKINEAQLEFFYKKILNRYSSNLNFCSFTVWGLSFKSGTNDIRESPALKLIKLLLPNVSHLYIYDSLVTQSQLKMSKQDLKKISFINTPYEKIKESNALIICNDDKEFCFPNFKYLRLLKDKVIFDGRNCIHSLKELCHNKLSYISLGRKVIY